MALAFDPNRTFFRGRKILLVNIYIDTLIKGLYSTTSSQKNKNIKLAEHRKVLLNRNNLPGLVPQSVFA